MIHEYEINHNGIRLRPLTSEDIETVRIWRNQDGIRKGFLDQSLIETSQQEEWFQRYSAKENDMMFIVEINLEGRHVSVGTAALYRIDPVKGDCEFGRLIIGEKAGKGLGVEITKALVGFAVELLQMNSINLQVLKDNDKAVHIYKKCGFAIKGESYVEGKQLYDMVYRKHLAVE